MADIGMATDTVDGIIPGDGRMPGDGGSHLTVTAEAILLQVVEAALFDLDWFMEILGRECD